MCRMQPIRISGILLAAFLFILPGVIPADAQEAGLLAKTPASDLAANPALLAHSRSMARGAGASQTHSAAIPPSSVYGGNAALAPGAVTVRDKDVAIADNLDDYDSEPVNSIADPLEPWNRFWFHFNDIFFLHVAKPVYDGWTWIAPQFVRTGISNIFHNAMFPTRFINSLLQFRLFEAGVEFSRFMMNMMGSAGFVDLASSQKTIVPVDPSGEDFGQTLGYWGVGQGFYLVWPFLGPSSLRDSVGRVGDAFTDPISYVKPWLASSGMETGFRFNELGKVLPAYENLKSISVDPYLAMREAYVTLREAQIKR